jgi:hypothetical protein
MFIKFGFSQEGFIDNCFTKFVNPTNGSRANTRVQADGYEAAN